MTSTAELKSSLDLHKRLVRMPNVHIRSAEGKMRIASASPSGMTLFTRVKSSSAFDSICVDVTALSAFMRGANEVELTVKDQSLSIRGRGIKGELPGVVEDYPRIPKVENKLLPEVDVAWLRKVIPHVALTALNKGGSFSAECDRAEWRLSCTDSIHGACAFGKGTTKLRFSLVPDDALVLKSMLELGDKSNVRISVLESSVVIFSGSNAAVIPTIDGEVQARENVIDGTKAIAKVEAPYLKEAISAITPFASVKEAPPIIFDFREQHLIIRASTSVGSIEQAVTAKVLAPIKVPLSFGLANTLISKLRDDVPVVVRTLTENKEVTRITFQSGSIHYLMLTSGS